MSQRDKFQYATYIVLLHKLIKEGKGDTEEADKLRDKMDPLWYKLGPEEAEELSGLEKAYETIRKYQKEV